MNTKLPKLFVPVVDPCVPDPCNGNGACSDGTCSCNLGYTGDDCSTGIVTVL